MKPKEYNYLAYPPEAASLQCRATLAQFTQANMTDAVRWFNSQTGDERVPLDLPMSKVATISDQSGKVVGVWFPDTRSRYDA
jgi:hypothetical protein